ncbi:cation:proton antiporter [Companilactobacillus sp.]|uniref:cation:proton antiporter n=1 Tax=Companilactobacillus sp. TaxID=2767905 RepID=UPI0025C0B58F|nr:sodium:proton antiporter [Companilactobacillus sp.]MCH4009206.1 sodium:proton antiporter [Companilactobacillus sp.]MCH4050615.1 sodium:proton antiporter [Companilactobacillus sp.]MCH4077148.1 sodium:proton antiporter [Companilactobacillus sp.]MCH4125724.1 sodium:proton antiporter [Companilactobacillus sp.]MCI1311433.1 sodium:proton antiporter [Companilactobacillus sp.]
MMEVFVSSITIVIAVAIANILARFVPNLSNTYINLAVGIVFGLIPYTDKLILNFDNEVFMFLIVAPLLYFEGQQTRNNTIVRQAGSIIGTAVLLAVIIAVVVGWSINLIFALGFPLALIMASISTPTDATAFGSVVEGRQVPQNVEKNLKLESLFNDATGIILLAAGMAWFETGHLSFAQNAGSFLYSAIGGMILGSVISFLLMLFRQMLLRSHINVISSQTIIFLITPFVIYYLAEELQMSGIIAVVCAGLINNSEASRSRFSSPHQFHLGVSLMNFISEVLNSFVFVVLGITLIRIIRDNFNEITHSLVWLWVGIVMYLISLIIRYLYAQFVLRNTSKDSIVFSLGGIHGAVTLAMVFSVSSKVLSLQKFNLLVLVETVVIILSMIVPTILFRFILPGTENDSHILDQMSVIREKMVQRGIGRVKKMDIDESVRKSVIYDLQDQNADNTTGDFLHQWRGVNQNAFDFDEDQKLQERRALMYAFTEERKYLHDISLEHKFDSKYIYSLTSEILLSESLVLDPINQQE